MQRRCKHGGNRADSLIPDSLIPDSLIPKSVLPGVIYKGENPEISGAGFLQGMVGDAHRLLDGWTMGQVDAIWNHLHVVITGWKIEHGEREGDAADWIAWLAGYPTFDDLLAETKAIDMKASGRKHEPLPRLLAVVVIKAGNVVTAMKAIGAVRESLRQSYRRHGAKSHDVVSATIVNYLSAKPGATNPEIEQHVLDKAEQHPLFNEPEAPAILDYFPHRGARDSKPLTRLQLQKRIWQNRNQIGIPKPNRPAAASKLCGVGSGINPAETPGNGLDGQLPACSVPGRQGAFKRGENK